MRTKYILSSHWHQHSLSGVSPFTRNGAIIIATKQNWDYALENGLLETGNLKSEELNVIEVTKDTILFVDSQFPIKVFYLDSTYTNKPTKDYLFFYLTKPAYLHASCMTAIGNKDLEKKGNYVYHERLVDLYRLINEKQLKVDKLIRLSREDYENGQFEPGIYDYLAVERFIKNGKSPEEIMKPFLGLSVSEIQEHRDSILTEFINQGVPHFAINKTVYECIKKMEFEKALLFAQILNIHSPGYLTFIDTMGEAFFVKGNLIAAKRISEILLQRDPNWQGGIKAWEENKKNNTY